jgi:hypothetical protein
MIDNLKKDFDSGWELNFDNFKDYFAEKYNFLISIDWLYF